MDGFINRVRLYGSFIFIAAIVTAMMFVSAGCVSSDKEEYYDVGATNSNEGLVKISINAELDSALSYAPDHAAMLTYSDRINTPIADSKLYQVNMYVSKVSVYSKGNSEYKIFEAESLVEGEVTLRNNYTNRNHSGWTGSVPEGTYDRIEIEVSEVGVKYADDTNQMQEWFARNYARKFVLKGGTHFNSFSIGKKQEVSFKVNFYITGRVGTSEAEFAPNVFAVRDEL